MSVVRLGSHKAQVGGHGIRAREEEEPPTIKNDFFVGDQRRRGVTSLEDAPQGGKTRNGKELMRWTEWGHLKG
jgi:hypothetical protein